MQEEKFYLVISFNRKNSKNRIKKVAETKIIAAPLVISKLYDIYKPKSVKTVEITADENIML